KARHPRTAVGFNGRKLYLFVTDGRQPGYSIGMSLPEVAQVMKELGCTDALNMDGGGSSTLWVRGSVVNRPSDGKERAVANGLLVFSTAPQGPPVRLAPRPSSVDALAGAEVPLSAVGEDEYYNPRPVPAGQARWSVPESLGSIVGERLVLRGDVAAAPEQECAAGELQVEWNGIRGAGSVRVYARPARLEISPPVARLGTLTQTRFRLRAFNQEGKPLLLPPAVHWEVSPELGSLDAEGTLSTPAAAGSGTVRATVCGVSAVARVAVAEAAARALDDFETATDWKSSASGGAVGTISLAPGVSHSGKRALRLEYDFSQGSGTRALYALGSRNLGTPFALRAWVYGDGQGAWLRARVRDARGQSHVLDLARKVDWKESWREL
ncbi:MAG TPA: phosphodiester glycosidase family protein, partial [Armatimonadota bacterium]|nr:phosphodiester glycosidase family protein [Armatimonadota bacterium]